MGAVGRAMSDRRKGRGLLAHNGSPATRGGNRPINSQAGSGGSWREPRWTVTPPSTWRQPVGDGPGAAMPAMPPGYTATDREGRPVTDEAALRVLWARECGYEGSLDRDGEPVGDPPIWSDQGCDDLHYTDWRH